MTGDDMSGNEILVRPFAGLRVSSEFAGRVAAPPYDVLTTEEARERARDNPWSFLHISKPEIDLPPGTGAHERAVYEKAAENMTRFCDAGVLRRDPAPCYYVYRLCAQGHTQTGIAAAGSVAAYRRGRIRRHELTRPDKEDDRLRHIIAVGAHTGPVLVAHQPQAEIGEVIARAAAGAAAAEATVDHARHTLWVISDSDEIARISRLFNSMEALYIADGHHRSAAAARAADTKVAANPDHTGDELYNNFLIVSFPADEVRILAYNRVVRDLHGLGKTAFLALLGASFEVAPEMDAVEPARRGEFGMYLDGRWYRLRPRQAPGRPGTDTAAAGTDLDTRLLSDRLLTPLLGIGDPRLDPRIDFVGGARGLGELERLVDSGKWTAAFSLYPTSMDDLIAVADAGEIMAPKSTWFEPKLADGLVSLPLA